MPPIRWGNDPLVPLMRGLALSLLVVVLLILPPAAAEGDAAPVVVTVGRLAVGDAFEYESTSRGTHLTRTQLRVIGSDVAQDAFGIERRTLAVGVQHRLVSGGDPAVRSSSDWSFDATCHWLEGGDDLVRIDFHARYDNVSREWGRFSMAAAGAAVDQSRAHGESRATSSFREIVDCRLDRRIDGRPFSAAEEVPRSVFVANDSPFWDAWHSRPAEPVTWMGRPALRIAWHVEDAPEEGRPAALADRSVVVADGVPGTVESVSGNGADVFAVRTLRAFVPGSAELAPDDDAQLPARNPSASWAEWDARTLDTRSFGLVQHFDEALAIIRLDPRIAHDAWLARNPDAVLTYAAMEHQRQPYESSLGFVSWTLAYAASDGGRRYWLLTNLVDPGVAGAEPLLVPQPVQLTETEGEDVASLRGEHAVMIDAQSTAELARAAGVLPESVTSLSFGLTPRSHLLSPQAILRLSAEPCCEADRAWSTVRLDLNKGAIEWIDDSTLRLERESMVPLRSLSAAPADSTSDAALAAMSTGAMSPTLAATGALAGAVVLALVAKLALLPLYSRLRRDRLLDNPTRARLYEVIRREPGLVLNDVAMRLGVAVSGGLRRHVDRLRRHGYVVVQEDDGRRRLYAAGEVPIEDARRHAALARPAARELYELARAEPHLSLRELAERLGRAPSTVHRAKRRLERAGLLAPPPRGEP